MFKHLFLTTIILAVLIAVMRMYAAEMDLIAEQRSVQGADRRAAIILTEADNALDDFDADKAMTLAVTVVKNPYATNHVKGTAYVIIGLAEIIKEQYDYAQKTLERVLILKDVEPEDVDTARQALQAVDVLKQRQMQKKLHKHASGSYT